MKGVKANTIGWAVLTCLLWSTAYPLVKIGLQYSTPLHFAGSRFILAGLMLLPFTVKPRQYIRMIRENYKLALWVTLLQTLINYVLFYIGLTYVPGSLGAVIVGSQPFVTAIVSRIMIKEERFTRAKVLTIIVGIAGILLVSAGRQRFNFSGPMELLGILLIFIANISTATSNVLVSLKIGKMSPVVLSSFSLFIGGVIIYIISMFTETRTATAAYPAEYWIVLGWLSFMSAFTFSMWYHLLKRPGVRVSELNLWKFILPVFGAILSWILVPGEKADWVTVTGMIIIALALIYFFGITGRKERRVEEVPAGPVAK
jgi:drug/metabolite transporter (DMT)-like permease